MKVPVNTRFVLLAVLIALSSLMTGCTIAEPDPGFEAVYLDRPYIAGHEGVRDETLKNGRDVTWPSTTIIYVETSPKVYHVAFQDFSSQDNILLDFETSVQIRVTDAARLMKDFGPKWFENNIQSPYTSIVREAVKRETMAEMMSSITAADTVDQQVTDAIRKIVKEDNIPVEVMKVTLGRAKPNDNVLTQMNKTAAEQQRNLTLIAATQAEGQRKLEQEAKAAADDAYRLKMGMTVEQIVAKQIAEINADACKTAKSCILAPAGASVLVGR